VKVRPDIQAAIARLKESKAIYDLNVDGDAYRRGRQWAAQSADYAELLRIREIDVDVETNDHRANLIKATTPEKYEDEEWWRRILFGSTEKPTDRYLVSWTKGVQTFVDEVWEQVHATA
jgi:hypothetical protein